MKDSHERRLRDLERRAGITPTEGADTEDDGETAIEDMSFEQAQECYHEAVDPDTPDPGGDVISRLYMQILETRDDDVPDLSSAEGADNTPEPDDHEDR